MGFYVNFRTKQGPTVLVSNIRNIDFYVRLEEIIRIKNFMAFTVYPIIIGQFVAAIYFF